MRQVLIDSSVAIAAFRNNEVVLRRLARVQAVVTMTILAEFYYGAYRAAQTGRQLAYIAGLIGNSVLLTGDRETADRYGALKHALRQQGMLIPENDLWIAAAALRHGLPLATRDTQHFGRVSGLDVELW